MNGCLALQDLIRTERLGHDRDRPGLRQITERQIPGMPPVNHLPAGGALIRPNEIPILG